MIAIVWFFLLITNVYGTAQTDWTEVDLTSHPTATAPEPNPLIEQNLLPRPYLYGSIQESCTPDNVKLLAFGILSGSLMVGAATLYYYLYA